MASHRFAALRAKHFNSPRGRHDRYACIAHEHKQVGISRHNQVRPCRYSHRKHGIIIWIAAERRSQILMGSNLGKACPETILSLLDNPFIQPPQIEAMLAALQDPSAIQPKIKTITTPKHVRPTEKQPANAAFPPPTPQARAGPIAATA